MLDSMGRLVSIYVVRPLMAIAVCALAATFVDGPADDFAQVALAIPTVVALLLSLIDWERMAFGAAGFAGAAALGLTLAGREASDTITGYDITFLVNWAIVSVFSGVPVYGIWFVWGAMGEVRHGIDDLVELQHDRQRALADAGAEPWNASGGSGHGPVSTILGVPVGGPGPDGSDAISTPAAPPPLPLERPANFAAEELVASIEAYQVNGEPWWKCKEPHVMVQYRDKAQMELESRVVPFLGWTKEPAPPPVRGARVRQKPGLFTFQFGIAPKFPDEALTVMWNRST